MKEELSKKVDDAISGKNDATSGKNDANKDAASDIGAGEHAHGKGIYSSMNFDYGCHRTDQFIRVQVRKQSSKRSNSRTCAHINPVVN